MGPIYSNGTPCYICLQEEAAQRQDIPFGDPVYARQVVQAVNALDAEGLLKGFMVYSVMAGAGAADLVGAIDAFQLGANAVYTLGPGADVTLGTSSWVDVGSIFGRVLNFTEKNWIALGEAGQKAAMSGFLDEAFQFQSQIIFTADPALAAEGSPLAFEYEYILRNGYKIVQQGTSWVVAY